MREPFIFFENKKEIRLIRYAFIDEMGKCIIIVIGEGRRNSMKISLSDPTEEEELIKNQYVDMLP